MKMKRNDLFHSLQFLHSLCCCICLTQKYNQKQMKENCKANEKSYYEKIKRKCHTQK